MNLEGDVLLNKRGYCQKVEENNWTQMFIHTNHEVLVCGFLVLDCIL